MNYGQVILLNGTSSAGKTSIAKALQATFVVPYLHVPIDAFYTMCPANLMNPSNIEEIEMWSQCMPLVISGFHQAIAALVKARNNVIVDHVMEEDGWLQECVRIWSRFSVCFVGVKCPIETLEQRERERGDRAISQARYQYPRVHRYDLYDVEVDTSVLSPDDCANRIIAYMECRERRRIPSAFRVLKKRFGREGQRGSTLDAQTVCG